MIIKKIKYSLNEVYRPVTQSQYTFAFASFGFGGLDKRVACNSWAVNVYIRVREYVIINWFHASIQRREWNERKKKSWQEIVQTTHSMFAVLFLFFSLIRRKWNEDIPENRSNDDYSVRYLGCSQTHTIVSFAYIVVVACLLGLFASFFCCLIAALPTPTIFSEKLTSLKTFWWFLERHSHSIYQVGNYQSSALFISKYRRQTLRSSSIVWFQNHITQ